MDDTGFLLDDALLEQLLRSSHGFPDLNNLASRSGPLLEYHLTLGHSKKRHSLRLLPAERQV